MGEEDMVGKGRGGEGRLGREGEGRMWLER